LKILTVTGVAEYIDQGIIAAFDLLDNKPKIRININNAKSSGIKISTELLKLSIVHE
jgi:hypothetical protein